MARETFMGRAVTHNSPARLQPAKAAEMLKNPPGGRPLSAKQDRFFRAVEHGWQPTRMK